MRLLRATLTTTAAVLLPAALTCSVIPGGEPAGHPPEGCEDRILMWDSHAPGEVWFVDQPTNCTAVKIWNGLNAALFADGTVQVWGSRYDALYEPPETATNAVALDVGYDHLLALLPDGTVAAWGRNDYGQCDVPETVVGAVAVAAGEYYSLALLSDGTVAAWGSNGDGRATVPGHVTNAVAVAAGFSHSLALLSDGTVAAWGNNWYGQTDAPSSLSGRSVVAIGANWANASWAVTQEGGLHVWGDALPPPVPHLHSPRFMRFLSYAGEPYYAWSGTNMAVVRVVAGGAAPDDADGDGISGRDELLVHNTDPHDPDTDHDGLKDGWELAYGLDPLDPADALLDHDGDGISTADEVNVFHTDPFLTDTDGDGLDDGLETLSYALFVYGTPENYTMEWAAPPPETNAAPAVAVGATKWDRSVLFADGRALQLRNGAGFGPVTLEGAAAMVPGAYQTLFIDPDGGALGVVCLDVDEYYIYEGAFGTFPEQAAAGILHAAGLLPDGSVTHIGAFADAQGVVHEDVPPPAGLSLTSVVPGADAGTLLGFTQHPAVATNPPAPFPAAAVAAGFYTSIALGGDGRVAMWGRPYYTLLDVPADLSNAVKVAGGVFHTSALLADGTVRAWGRNTYKQLNIPAGLSNVVDIACTDLATVALREDGTLAAWGFDMDTAVTECPTNATGCVSVHAAGDGAWGLTADGRIFGWGNESMPVNLLPWEAVSAAFANPQYGNRRGVALVRLGTNPLAADSDSDGLPDGLEYTLGFDPRNPADGTDADANGLPDLWETVYFGATGQDPHADPDGDGIPNHAECRLGGDPLFSVRAASASRGWHGLAWNAFPGAASYSVAVFSGGQAVTTLVTSATTAALTGRLPSPTCAATVTALSPAAQPLRTASESWTQPAAGSGVTAWKIAPAFTVHRPAGYAFTNLLDLTLTVNRTAQWEDFFVSSSPSAGGWSLSDATLAWSDGTGAGAASASPPGDSWPLAGVSADAATLNLRLDMPPGEGTTRSAAPLYLLRWAPELGFEVPAEINTPAHIIATERRAFVVENGPPLSLPGITVNAGGHPRLSSPPSYPKTIPASPSPQASVPTNSLFVWGSGVVHGAAITPGEAGLASLAFGSAGVPPPAQPAQRPFLSAAVSPLSDPAPGPDDDLTVDVTCIRYTIDHHWADTDPLDPLKEICRLPCRYPGCALSDYDNFFCDDYTDDPSGTVNSSHFTFSVGSGSDEISSYPESGVKTAFDTVPYPVTITWANASIFSGAVFPEPFLRGKGCVYDPAYTNEIDSCRGSTGKGGCGCEGIDCDDEGPGIGSARFLLNLGASGARASDGALYFNTPTPEVSRANLRLFNDGSANVSSNAGGIASVETGFRTVTAADIPHGFYLAVASALPGEDRVWEITNPGGDTSLARFVKNPAGLAEAFNLRGPDANGWWRLETLDTAGSARSVFAKRTFGDAEETVEEATLEPGGGDPGSPFPGFRRLAHTRTVYTYVDGREVVLREETWNSATGAFETRLHTYASTSGYIALSVQPRLTVHPDGSWEHFTYDASGRTVLRAVPARPGVEPPAAPALSDPFTLPGARVTAYTYPPPTNDVLPLLARVTAESIVTEQGPVPVSLSWAEAAVVTNAVGGEPTPCLSNAVIRARAPDALKDDPANAVSVEVACGSHREDWRRSLPVYRRSEDGLETRWRYEEGTLAGGAFIPGADGPHVRAVSVTLPPAGTPVPENAATAEVEVTDARWGHTLLRETRLPPGGDISGDPAAWPLLSWSRHTYDGTRLIASLHSDGTSESNLWDCCRLVSATARDGTVTEHDTFPADGLTFTREVSLAALPGADGRHPATETYADGLGRVTNSLRAVWFNGARDPAYAPLETRTVYPHGTGDRSVTTDPLGVQTLTTRYYGDGSETEETVTPGVTNRVTYSIGGGTVAERLWDGKYTRETRSGSFTADGLRVETAVMESSDYPAVTNSVTSYDFLGREVCVLTPAFGGGFLFASNFYDGASSRLLRSTRTGSPGTLYAYDALGNLTHTALDVNGNGVIDLAGPDRVTATHETYEQDAFGDWWRVAASAVWPETGSAASLTASVTRVRLTGLGSPPPVTYSMLPVTSLLTAQTETLDWRGNITRASTYTDAASAAAWAITETPGSSIPSLQKTVAGLPVLAVSSSAVTNTLAYDGFARQTAFTDGRGNTNSVSYDALGQVSATEDADTHRTSYAYDAFGRQAAVTDALSNTVYTAYDSVGNVAAQWSAAYPAAYEYDTAGRMVQMGTYRGTTEITDYASFQSLVSSFDKTVWLYDQPTGLLTNKLHADGLGPSYAYTPDGRLSVRTWARGVVTEYAYDAFGQVTNTAYSDATPWVSYTYDRLGRVTSAATSHSPNQFLIEEVIPYLPPLVTNLFFYSGLDPAAESQPDVYIARSRDTFGRPSATVFNGEFGVLYEYDGSGRIAAIQAAAVTNEYAPLFSHTFRYSRLPGTDFITGHTATSPVSGFQFQVSKTHEPHRDLVASVSNRWDTSAISSFLYGNDASGRRGRRTDTSPGSSATNLFAYNPRSELASALMGTNAYIYAYDPAGNREWAALNAETNAYTANALNQYTGVAGGAAVPSAYDEDGNLTACALPDGDWLFSWDAENRLAAAERLTFDASGHRVRVRNVYDPHSRRAVRQLQRRHSTGDTGMLPEEIRWGVPVSSSAFAWDGWHPVREHVSTNTLTGAPPDLRYRLWGLDLSGAPGGGGGVGGLLAEYRGIAPRPAAVLTGGAGARAVIPPADPGPETPSASVWFPCYDANGNVTEYVDTDGAVAARYEYDPFGNTTAMSGPMADTFPFRFSTKYFDAETGFYYYGYRYYSPELGRWLNRDPIEEEGGLNLYGFVGNDPVNRWDRLGLEFGITYVQFEGLLGHGWIRTGDFQTYDITTMFAQTITYNGTIYQVNSATAVLPVGIGFYPSVEVTPLQALIGVPGQWKYEQEKELVAVSAKDMLKQWDTELKTRRLFGIRAAIFKYGSAKDKCCKDANRDDVLGCIMDYKNKHPRSTYRLPFLSCRSRAKDALEACCLKVGGRIPTTVGEVRINVMPIGSAP